MSPPLSSRGLFAVMELPVWLAQLPLVGSLSNILLDVVFVYGLRWGMFGAAFATGLSPVVTLICCCPYFIKKQNQFKLTAVTEPAKRIFDILKLGFPSFIAGIASSFTMLVFNKQLLKLGGNLALTAYGILVNLSVIFNCLNNGITQGVGPLFSDSFGSQGFSFVKLLYSDYDHRCCFLFYSLLRIDLDISGFPDWHF